MKLSVVIPVYSEEEALRGVVCGLLQRVSGILHQIILIVSPKSNARTFAICEELTRLDPRVEHHVQQENPGIGRAYRQAFARVTGTHVLIIDADGEMDLDAVPQFVAAARQGAELVLGSRWIRGGGAVGYDRTTYVLNRGFQYLFRLLFWTRVHDLTYGFKLFDARRLLRQDRCHRCLWRLSPERVNVREHFEKYNTERKHVCSGIEIVSACLLRRHIRRSSSDHDTGARQLLGGIFGPYIFGASNNPGQSKVHELDVTVPREHDVGWFEIAMNDRLIMRIGKRLGDFGADLQSFLDGNSPGL